MNSKWLSSARSALIVFIALLSPGVVASCVLPPTGIVAWWPGEGNANDVIGGNNGMLQGGATFASGKVGQGFRFDGTSGYVQIPDSAALKPTNVTCEAWVWLDPYLPANRGAEVIVFKKNTWSAWFEGYALAKGTIDNGNGTSSDRFQFVVSRYGNQVAINSQTIAQRGVWYHVAATYDGNQSKLYVNGVLEASATPGFALDYDTTPIFIGTSGTWAPYLSMFAGIIDELSIYNRALSSSEIAAIYNAGSAGKCGSPVVSCTPAPANLVAWLQAEGNLNDSAGTNNGIQTGGVTFSTGEVGRGFYFSGSSQIKLSASPGLNVGTSGGLTLETWIRPGHFTLYEPQFVFEWNDGAGNSGVHFTLSTDHGVYGDGFGNILVNVVDTLGNSHGIFTAANVLVTNALQHVAFTYDKASGNAVIYVNGLALASTNLGSFTPQTSYDFYLANRVSGPFAGNYFNGQLDEPSLYNRALSISEIQSIYLAGSAGKCAPTVATNNCAAPPAGLVSWWQGEGNANDIVGGNNGILQGGVSIASGEVGHAFHFDDNTTNEGVQIAASPGLNVGTSGGFTLEAWIKPTDTIDTQWLMGWKTPDGTASIYGSHFKMSQPGSAGSGSGCLFASVVDLGGSGHWISSPAGILSSNVFQHVALTYDQASGMATIYLNGVVVAQQNLGSFTPQTTYPFYLGAQTSQDSGENNFSGLLDEASVYNRALSSNEITAIYNAGSAGKCTPTVATNSCAPPPAGLVGWWKGDGTAVDVVSSNNGVLVNAGYTSGVVGQAFSFDPENYPYTYTGVQIADQPAYALTNSLTIEGWVRPRGDGYVIFFRGDNRPGLDPYVLAMQANHTLLFQITDANGNGTSVPAVLAYNQWTHVAATLDGGSGTMSIYTNGALAAQAVTTIRPFGALIPGDSPGIGIGNLNDGGNNFPFLGDIDEISLYNRALTATEIQGVYNAGSAGKCPIPTPPVIISQPTNQAVTMGNTATFTVMATGAQPLNYQWNFAGTNIVGATNATLTLVNVQFTNAGNYSVTVTNVYDSVMSSNALLTVNPVVCVAPPAALISWWRAESNALDEISGNDGVLMNGTGFAPGEVGTAFSFDGVSNYVQIPSSPLISPTGSFTIEAWIKYDQLTGTNGATIAMKGPDTEDTPDWSLGISPAQKLRVGVTADGVWTYLDCSTTLLPGVWYHVGMIFNGTFVCGAVNGAYDGCQLAFYGQGKVRASNYPMKIGAQASGSPAAGSSFFSGQIDELSFYARPFGYYGDTDMFNIYNAGSAGKCDVPVAPTLVVNPQDTSVLPGMNAIFTVAVGGSRPLSYQWFVNGSPMDGETNATLTLTNIQYAQSGNGYSVIATNAAGSVTSGSAALNVINTPPQISTIPNQTISYNTATAPIGFTVSDAESPASSLVVTGVSSNTNLVPNEQIIFSGTDTNRTVTLTPNSNQFGVTTITLTITDPGNLSSQTSFNLTVTNFPPQIGSIPNQVISYNTATAPLAFTVSDAETPADSLVLTPSSSNTNLLPVSQIMLAGSGTNRTVMLTPNTNQFGVATITLSIADELGATNQSVFKLTVTNYPPQISGIAAQRAPLNATIGPLAFTVSDAETPADQLVVTPTSSNNNIVPTNQIVLGGSGTNRTVTIVPGTNSPGTATVTLTVTDALGASRSTSFSVTLDLFTQIAPGFPPLTYSAIAWGDYDNDGQLDLLVSGTTNGLASGAITRIYHNINDGNVSTHGPFDPSSFISLTNLYKSAVAWVDYDRDGRLDAIVSGINSANIAVAQLYHNNGDGTFTPVNAGFAGAYSGTLAWGDFDNDGAPDLFLSGLNIVSSNGVTAVTTNIAKLYRNNGDGTFTDMNANFLTADNRNAGPNNGTAAWGDFDNDGKQDLLLAGSINNGSSGIASVYQNLGGGVFSNAFTSTYASGFYPGGTGAWADFDDDGWLDFAISSPSATTAIYRNNRAGSFTLATTMSPTTTPIVSWGDYNNDGYPDLLVGGSTSTLYRNNGNGTFTSSGISLPTILNGSLAWGDYNNDGNLDILFAGSSTTIYRNNSGTANTAPAAPYDLAFTIAPTNSVVLRWQAPVDSQTKSNGLNYNLRVGTTPGGVDVVSPMADPITGQRRVAALGNVGPTNRALLINLPKGTYYWSVQAIDTAFAGSPFFQLPGGIDRTFTITNARPTITPIPDQFIAPGTNAPGPVVPFTINDAETWPGNLTITVRSSNTNVVAPTNIVVTRPFDNHQIPPTNCTIRIAARTNGTSLITVTVADAQGAFASDYFIVTADPFMLVSSNFVQVQNSLIAWGDYNNDGRLDVLIAGNTNSNPQLKPVTQLYRNDGNGVFTPVATGLPGVTYGSAVWGDFNNDGNLDLILTGTTNGATSGAIARIYRNNGDGTFTDMGAGLPGVFNSAVAWGDFDNDGRLDLLLTGTTNGAASGAIAQIYHNNGNGMFSLAVTLPGILLGAVAIADFDGDGDLDLVIAGMNSTAVATTYVYRNNGDGTFTQAASLTGVYNGSVATGDFDNDGRPDILLAGFNGSTATSLVYRNNGNFSFSNIGASLPAARLASVAWGDFDNDGRLDFLISGTGNGAGSGAFTRVYRNTGSPVLSQSFSNYSTTLPTNYSGTVTWADFNNDGKLDILLAGTDGTPLAGPTRSQTLLFRNNSGISNTAPTAPTALAFARSNNVISLTWAKSTDAQTTNSNGLKYQIRVGATSGGIEIESPASDLTTGYRRVVQAGDASTNQWRLANLPPGNYFWSVQAIDTAFAGSPFATESSFTVLPSPTTVADAFSTPTNTPVTFAAAKLALNDIDPNGYPLTVIGVSSNSVMSGSVSLAAGMVTYAPPANFSGNDAFTYTVTDGQSAPTVGVVTVTVGSGGAISLNIVYGPVMDNGNFVVDFAGIPGLTYTVEAASDLGGPWSKVANLTAPTTDLGFGVGIFEFREPAGTNSTRFYRTVYPSY